MDPAYLRGIKVLHYSGVALSHSPERDAVLKAVKETRASGGLVSYDPNIRLERELSLNASLNREEWSYSHPERAKPRHVCVTSVVFHTRRCTGRSNRFDEPNQAGSVSSPYARL